MTCEVCGHEGARTRKVPFSAPPFVYELDLCADCWLDWQAAKRKEE